MKEMNWRAALAEFIGTFGFLVVGVGSVVATGGNLIMVAIAHGLAIAVFATAMGPISGGHLNPAVSLAFWLGGKISLGQAGANIVAQIAGATAGVFALVGMFGEGVMGIGKYGLPEPSQATQFGQLVAFETVFTFFLMLAVWGTAVHKKAPQMGALFVGLTVLMSIYACGPSTGCSLNPARYLGPAFAAQDFSQAVAYIASPILGAALAVIVYKMILEKPEESAPVS